MFPSDETRLRAFDRRVAWRVAAGALGFRLLVSLLGLFINLGFPHLTERQWYGWQDYQIVKVFTVPSAFWDQFARWDSGWYWGIAHDGYSYFEDSRSTIGYFPVYPMAMRYVGRLFGTYHAAPYFGGIVVSWLAFVGAMVAFYFLARLDLPPRRALMAVLLIAVFPFSYFFGVVYSESTFLCFTILAFYLFRTRRWIAGGLAAAVAIATRVPGILMWPALAWIAWRQAAPTVRDRGLAALGLILATGGFVWYCAYVYSVSGHPFAWVDAIHKWDYHPGGAPWRAPLELAGRLVTHPYRYLTGSEQALYDTLYGVTGIIFVALAFAVWRRFGLAYGMFMLLSLALPLSSGAFEGVGRYCSVLFPAFLWLAAIRSRAAVTLVVVVCALLYPIGFALFITNRPLY